MWGQGCLKEGMSPWTYVEELRLLKWLWEQANGPPSVLKREWPHWAGLPLGVHKPRGLRDPHSGVEATEMVVWMSRDREGKSLVKPHCKQHQASKPMHPPVACMPSHAAAGRIASRHRSLDIKGMCVYCFHMNCLTFVHGCTAPLQ